MFNYAATDGSASTNGVLTVSITGTNDAPVVVADTTLVMEDSALTAIGNVLGNDSDVDSGTTLQVAAPGTYAGQYGILVLDANGGYTYTLDNGSAAVQSLAQGASVTEVFNYAATDGSASTTGVLAVSITGTNDAPVVVADTTLVMEDSTLTATGNVLDNDSDVDAGTTLQVSAPGTYVGSYGTLILDANGSYTYTLDNESSSVQSLLEGETVNDVFSYAASDGITSTPSILTLAITGSNNAPIVQADTAALSEDDVATATGNVLANDSDVDAGTALQVAAPGTFAGAYGTLVLNAAGSYTYTLDNNSSAVQGLGQGETVNDVFSYAASDGIASTPSILTLTITGSNDVPVAQVAAAVLNEDDVVTVTGNVLANDSDVDAGTTLQVATPGTFAGMYGTLVLDANGGYTYTLDNERLSVQSLAQDETVNDVFSYAASDGITSTPSILTLAITGSNDAPVVQTDMAALSEDGVVTATGNVLANDSDVDAGTTLQVAAPGTYAGTYGTLVLDADGSYAYTLDNNSSAVQGLGQGVTVNDVFNYAASDGATSPSANLTLTISGKNDAPILAVGIPSYQMVVAGSLYSFQVPANTFADVDVSDNLSYSATLSDGQPLPTWLSFNAATQTFSGTPIHPGEYLNLKVVAADPYGGSASGVFNLGVRETAPVYGTDSNDLMEGTVADDRFESFGGDDVIRGFGGNDALNGGTGNDVLEGGTGNDTYFVDSVGDVVTENANEGTDTVLSSITYTLGANVENLYLIGTAAINGTGNDGDNTLSGNSANNWLTSGAGNDTLVGGTGADTMIGGTGNDTYYVDSTGDVVTENANEGADTVTSSITYTLGANVENLTLNGTASIRGTGNNGDNVITGNSAANTLTGSAGNDILQGWGGNDTLIGTSGNNLLAGGTGADTLTSSDGNDLYIGGSGNDTINTGAGYDIIAFNRGNGVDTVKISDGQDNTLSLGGGIRNTDLAFNKSSNDLILDTGSGENIVLQGWYASTHNKSVLNLQMIEEASIDFAPGGGNPLTDNKVENFNFAGLVNAFDQARAANPNLTSWALSDALLTFYLGGSDTEAIGGDLAYQYGKTGSLSNIGSTAAQGMLGNVQFGQVNQAINQVGLSDGAVRLSA